MKKIKIKYNEIWKRIYIDGIKTKYKISNKGRVINSDTNIITKGWLTNTGYRRTTLYINGTKRTVRIHRLVAYYFIDNPNNKDEVNHKNGKKDFNWIMNLEWCTRMENQTHAINTGLWNKYQANPPKGINHHSNKYSEQQILLICEMIESGFSNAYIRKNIGFKIYDKLPSEIRTRKRWKHISKDYNW